MTKAIPKTQEPERPIVAIYQNSDHVAGLVQQIFNSPLVTEESLEEFDDSSRTGTVDADLNVGIDANVKLPLVANASATGSVDGSLSRSKVVATGSKTKQSFVYSQAYYLNTVRRSLRNLELLKPLGSKSDGHELRSGDFVEFEATFSPSELLTFTDVLTPDLVAEIAKFLTKRAELALFDGYDSFQQQQAAILKMGATAEARAELARAVTTAVKADFRQDKTREYYGHVGTGSDAITAITICDNSYFVVEDEDRILDGTFTVLGKVTSGPEEDVPVLQRNKLLRNVSADGVDALVGQVTSILAGQKPAQIGGMSISKLLDLQLSSRISGTSVRVMPLAIYV